MQFGVFLKTGMNRRMDTAVYLQIKSFIVNPELSPHSPSRTPEQAFLPFDVQRNRLAFRFRMPSEINGLYFATLLFTPLSAAKYPLSRPKSALPTGG